MKSEVIKRIEAKMNQDPWYIKLKRWIKIEYIVLYLRTRYLWDKTYKGFVFKKKS